MNKTINNTTSNSKGIENMEKMKKYVDSIKEFKKEDILKGDLEKLEKTKKNIEICLKGLKDELNKTTTNKLNNFIKWIDIEIKEILDADNETTKEPEKVASKKGYKNNTKNNTKDDTKNIKNKEEIKEPKEEIKDVVNAEKVELNNIPNLEPSEKYYITLETGETFRVVYMDDEETVLLDKEGVINCKTNKFKKGLVYYVVDKKTFAFDIINSFKTK